MIRDSGQFQSFDGLDNRKTVMDLFKKMGRGLPDDLAGMRRAGFLQGLVMLSGNGFKSRPMFVDPCSASEAYGIFVAVTGVLGVPIETAAVLLEQVVRQMSLPQCQRG